MPRRARMYLPKFAYHIVQRGNNREACFINPEDYQLYLDLWQTCASRYKVNVHAYCLMTNHIHFLATPANSTGLSNTLKVVGSRYAYHINRTYKRTGTLWEGRHRSSLVQNNRYLLTCYRYIELNPVRAAMVDRPEEYRWSSYGFNAWRDAGWLVPHEDYIQLGQSKAQRCYAYRELFKTHINAQNLHLIRQAAHYCQPVAGEFFRHQIEEKYGIKFGYMDRGRPRKSG